MQHGVGVASACVAGVLLGLLFSGCVEEDEHIRSPTSLATSSSPPRRVVRKAESVENALDLRAHQKRQSVLFDSLSEGFAAGTLSLLRTSIELSEPGGFLLRTTGGGNAHVEWDVALDPDSVFEVEFEASNDAPCLVRLFWRREGEPFDFARQAAWPMPESGKQLGRRILRGSPGFEGKIVAVRLQVEATTPVTLQAVALDELGWADDYGVDRVAEDPLTSIRLGSEVRPAFLLAPGDARSQELQPGRWRLRGAAVHAGATTRKLLLSIERGGVVVETRLQRIPPVEPKGQTVLWHEVFWDVELDEPAELVYSLEEDESNAAVVVAALTPLPRDAASDARAILVSLDTVRADILGLYGAAGNPSPHLDRWAASATVFEHAYSTSSWTLPSHMSMLTGFWPTRHAVEGGNRVYPASQPSLAKALREAGFWTEAWTEGGFVDPRFGYASGFDRYVVLPSNHMLEAAVDGALDSLKKTTGPTFLFLHSYEAHAPYHPDQEAFARYAGRNSTEGLPSRGEMWAWMEEWRRNGERLPQERLDLLFAAYRAGIPRVDRQFGRFVEGLDALPEATPEILAVTSDHGDVFQERSLLLEHGQELQPELLRVPLVVQTGREGDAGRREDIASIADLPETFLDLLGLRLLDSDGAALFSAAGRGREAVEAAVQPPFDAAYRMARVTTERVEVVEIGEVVGDAFAVTWTDPARLESEADRSGVETLWAADQRGRTEIAIRFASAQGTGAIEIESAGMIRDAVVWPSVGVALDRVGDRSLRLRLVPSKPTHWATVAFESMPGATGLRVAIPESLGPLGVVCGNDPDPGDAAECARAAREGNGGAPTLDAAEGGQVRILHHAGAPFVDADSDGVVEGASAPAVDEALAAQLEALGYGDAALGKPTGAGEMDRVGGAAEADPDRIVVQRIPGR